MNVEEEGTLSSKKIFVADDSKGWGLVFEAVPRSIYSDVQSNAGMRQLRWAQGARHSRFREYTDYRGEGGLVLFSLSSKRFLFKFRNPARHALINALMSRSVSSHTV